jgi:hypothetical protein
LATETSLSKPWDGDECRKYRQGAAQDAIEKPLDMRYD